MLRIIENSGVRGSGTWRQRRGGTGPRKAKRAAKRTPPALNDYRFFLPFFLVAFFFAFFFAIVDSPL